ncbi:MAG TPA: hypothetical protein DDX51_07020 [Clostridiales bacterium]|nr:hypothetical protein [Clostridiales bacterium]
MNYIVLDLEWNQPRSAAELIQTPFAFDSEIIEIGAVKLNERFEAVDEFKILISPTFYTVLNGRVSRLTRIYKGMLKTGVPFPQAYREFLTWCGEEYAFLTWGPTDIPVLMDNLLMHRMSLDSVRECYDLQRMFGNEILRENRQCSLENAMKLLRFPMERGHDALNDAKNTVRIAGFMDLEKYMEEYVTIYVNYEEDRAGAAFAEKEFSNMTQALKDPDVVSFSCPYCGADIVCEEFVPSGTGKTLGYASCPEEDEFLLRLSGFPAAEKGIHVRRMIFEMSDDLWDIYQTAVERRDEKLREKQGME